MTSEVLITAELKESTLSDAIMKNVKKLFHLPLQTKWTPSNNFELNLFVYFIYLTLAQPDSPGGIEPI